MRILLDKIMTSKNLTIRQVSHLTGISKSSIQRIMNNEISPSADTLECLAKGLKVRISDLYHKSVCFRFPLAMCIYSKGINPKIISKIRTNVRKIY